MEKKVKTLKLALFRVPTNCPTTNVFTKNIDTTATHPNYLSSTFLPNENSFL